MKKKRPAILAQSIGALLALSALAPLARATQIWDGGGVDDLWSTNNNWFANTAPNFANTLFFNGGARLTPVNSTQASVAGLTFNALAGAFTLTGSGVGDSITLGGDITNNSTNNAQTISFATITLTGNRNLNANTNALTVNSDIVLGANTLTAVATNDITLNGAITGTGGLVKNNAGTLFLGGTNSYSGTTTLSDGFLVAQISSALSPNSTFIVRGSATLDVAGNDSTIGGLNDGGFTSGRVVNNTLAAATLTVGSGNASGSFGGTIENSGGPLGIRKIGTGTQILSNDNTYIGETIVDAGRLEITGSVGSAVVTVNGGTLLVGKSGALPGVPAVSVTGGGFEYHASTNTPLALSDLLVTSGPGTTIGGSIGATTTGAQIQVAGSVAPTSGPVKVNVFAVPGVATGATGSYTLLSAGVGSTLSTDATYSLGTILNPTNFIVGAPVATATTLTVQVTAVTPLANAFWVGGLGIGPGDWSLSTGAATNWASDNTGTATPLVPGAGTNVFFSAGIPATPTSPVGMSLGSSMSIGSLTVNAATAPETRTVTLEDTTGNTLTVAGAGGITINAGAGAVTLNPKITVGAAHTWTNNSANLFTLGGTVSNGANRLTVAGTGNTIFTGEFDNGVGGLTKAGSGRLTLTRSTLNTGGALLTGGALFADANAAFGSGTLTINSAGGTVTLGSNTPGTTLVNPISVQSNFTVVAPSAGNQRIFLVGPMDLNGSVRTLNGLTPKGEVNLHGVISNGGMTFNSSVDYTAYIMGDGRDNPNTDAANTYTGLTTVNDNVYLVLNKSLVSPGIDGAVRGDVVQNGTGSLDYFQPNQIADTASVTVNGQGNTLGSELYAGMQLNDHNETIGSLLGASTGLVQLGSATLTVGAGNFPGVIRDGFSGSGGDFVKNTTGTLTLAGTNSYTGTTTVTGGTLSVTGSLTSTTVNVTGGTFIAGKAGALPAAANVTVATGAGFEYRGATDAPLAINTLTLNSGAGTTIGGSIGAGPTSAQITVATAVTPTEGAIRVNVFGIPGLGARTPGTYTLLTAAAGSTLDVGTAYALGNIFNAANFTVSAPTATATAITVQIAAATPLANAFWVGGLSGNPNDWAASNGSTASNWASDNTGTPTPLVPGATTNVFFSAGSLATPTDPGSTTMGDSMSIASLTVNAASSPETRAVTLASSGGNTLTVGAGGITIHAGAGAVTLNPNMVLGASETWTNNSANLFTAGGNVSNGANLLTVTGSGNTTIAGALGNGTGGLTKTGTGRLTLAGSNTYTGDTRLLGGALFTDANTALGTGRLAIAAATTLGSNVTGTRLANPISVEADFSVIAPSSGAHDFFLNGALDLNGATRTITGLTHQGQVHFGGVISNGGLTFTTSGLPVPVNGDNSYVAFIHDGTASHTYTGLTTVENNAFVVLLSAGEKFRGDFLIQGQGVLDYLGFGNQIADTATVTVNGSGSVILDGIDFAGFELRDFDETIGVLNGSSVGTVGLGSAVLTVGAGTFNGVIRDGTVGSGRAGQLVKNTPGTLTLNGANTYTGNTSINNGTLVLNGSVQSPTVFVNFAGTLMGTGTAFRDVRNAGVFSPGNSTGTFRIRGNYLQTGAGTMVIEISGTKAGQHDLVAVSGQATLDGTLRLVRTGGGRLKPGDKVTFLTATGVTGKFATEENDFATDRTIVEAEVVYGSNAVSLEMQQGSFELLAQERGFTPNQRAVGAMLDEVARHSGSNHQLIDFLNGEPLANLPADFDRIAPDELQAIFTIGTSQANAQTANLQRRFEDIRAGRLGFSADGLSVTGPAFLNDTPVGAEGPVGPIAPGAKEIRPPEAAAAPAEQRYGVFITGTGEFASVGDTKRAGGYDLATGGFTIGVDYKVNDHFTVGLNTGYARTGTDGFGGSRVTVDGAKLGAYATYFTGEGFYADAAIQGGLNSYDTRRSALRGTASGSTTGGEFNGLIATGFDFTNEALRVGPIASFQYTHIGFSGYGESGSLAPLRYGSQGTTSMRSAIGMKASYEFRREGLVIRPEIRAAWQHEFGDIHQAIESTLASGGPAFTVQGAEIGRESLLLGLGVAVLWNERTATYLYYDGELLRSNYTSNNVSAGVRMSF